MLRYGSSYHHGCLRAFDDQPLMPISTGVKAFHCRSRVKVSALPPKIASTSPAA
ncbi:hypothetical protein NB689_003238 [Xanthomonas sacchari]|nr:hypothetical protein [Xanthomonas sacchari]MCW0450321.1 hypothetical protein [Xanthomonas sacchari]